MNIFVVSDDPFKCAKALDDLRLNKMVLETAQLLSTAAHLTGSTVTYRPTHVNHPCSVWVRTSINNYMWTMLLFDALCEEYLRRSNKRHKCETLRDELLNGMANMPAGPRTPFANCTPYKQLETTQAYKMTLLEKWFSNSRKTVPKYKKEILNLELAKYLLGSDIEVVAKTLPHAT